MLRFFDHEREERTDIGRQPAAVATRSNGAAQESLQVEIQAWARKKTDTAREIDLSAPVC